MAKVNFMCDTVEGAIDACSKKQQPGRWPRPVARARTAIMGKGGSRTGDLRIELEEILAAIHARRPRPSWAAAVAEIAQHEFDIRGGSTAAIFADPEGRGELEPLLDDILASAYDLGLWDDDWGADGRARQYASVAAGSKKRAGDDDGDNAPAVPAATVRTVKKALGAC
eukprot:COSAG01_NODE_32694_length_577_cov_0.861925_1_plen_168_part_10